MPKWLRANKNICLSGGQTWWNTGIRKIHHPRPWISQGYGLRDLGALDFLPIFAEWDALRTGFHGFPRGLKDKTQKKAERMVAKMSKWVEEGDVDPLMLGELWDLDDV